jgi:hypothetical protein
MKEELIKYVMAQANKCYADDFPIIKIENWIREFFESYQPERSKREDINYYGMKAEIKEDGLCYLEDGKIIDPSQLIDDAVL